MKPAAFFALAAVCLSALCGCAGKSSSAKDAFYSPSVVPELFSAYPESVLKNVVKPSSDSRAESLAEYSYMTEDGLQTAHTPVSASYRRSDGALSVSVGEHVFVFGETLAADGYNVRDITDKKTLQRALYVFITAFCRNTDNGDFNTAPDSIRAAEDDVEVERVTLRLDKEKYAPAFDAAIEAVKSDAELRDHLTDVLGLYGFLHNREQSAGELFDSLCAKITEAVKNAEGQLVWQRYVRNGKTVAARLKFGDNVIRYICAEASSYTELDLSAKLNGADFTLGYEARRTGMSDTYNVRISNGGEITYFDGTAESAYKSGNVVFELRATKDGSVINGLKIETSFDGQKKPTYKGKGNLVRNGDKKTFTFDITFETTDAPDIKPAQNGGRDLYEAVKKAFG